jgi:hypothetical protein
MPRASNQLQHQSGSGVFHGARGADGSIASARSLKTLADCVDQNTDRLKVDIEDASGQGLATEAKQDDQIALLQGKAPALNRTEAIPVQLVVGSTGSNYDALRANGQDLMVMIDDMNPDVATNSGLARSDKQDTLNASLASVGTDQIRVDIVSGGGGGDATAANQVTGNASLATIAGDTTSLDGKVTACNTGAVVVSSSALPAGASTAAKQPALGTAGTASSDVLSVQGISSMTPLVVDGSASTQPVSGTVTANAGTGTFAVSASALPLPSGAATSALQSTGNASLATIAGDTTSLDGKVTACNTGAVVVASGAITETNSTAILADTASLDAKIVTSAPVGSDGTTTAQTVNLMGSADGTNFRTVKTGTGGELIMEVQHSWDITNVLINNVAVAAGAQQLSAEFDLGQGVSHEIGRIEVFVDNSAGVSLEIIGATRHTSSGTEYFPHDAPAVTSTEESFTFSQDDVGLSMGHRFMLFQVENKDGSTSTNVTLRVAYYK